MGGGGGSMMRVVHRTVARAGAASLPDPILSTTATRATSPSASSRRIHRTNSCNSNNLTLLSESGSSLPERKSGSSTGNYWPSYRGSLCPDECDWVAVDKNQVDRIREANDDFYSWNAPSYEEIHSAVSALTRVYGGAADSLPVRDKFTCDVDREVAGSLQLSSPAGSEVDWSEPSLLLCNSTTLQASESKGVSDAIHLLQTDPSIQRMVVSLSSDRAVWDAIMSNGVVQEVCNACRADRNTSPTTSCSTTDPADPGAIGFLKQLFSNAKLRIKMLMEKVHLLVNEFFKRLEEEIPKETDEKLRISFMLSMLVLFVVVVARFQRA